MSYISLTNLFFLVVLSFAQDGGFGSLTRAEKEKVCLVLFHAAAWLRELLNAFSGGLGDSAAERDEDEDAKLISRLKSLVQLEALLQVSCIPSNGCTAFAS